MMNDRKNRNRGKKRSRFARWFSDPNRTIFKRTYSEVALLAAFYTSFTGAIIALLCLKIFVLMIIIGNYGSPWLGLDDSCLGNVPGLGYRPALSLHSPLIWYKWTRDEMYYTSYVQDIELFMHTYEMANPDLYRDCDAEPSASGSGQSSLRRPCYFNKSQLGPCANTSYGYMLMQPCVYLKVNRINDWVPDCYNKDSELPKEMPNDLKKYIAEEAASEGDILWISCEGYHPSDVEHVGKISYYPQPGFKADYFPYKGNPNYLSPIVAIQFNEPMKDLLITVKCHAWAKNIATATSRPVNTDFQLMIGQMPQRKQ